MNNMFLTSVIYSGVSIQSNGKAFSIFDSAVPGSIPIVEVNVNTNMTVNIPFNINSIVSADALLLIDNGTQNTAFGINALNSITTGTKNSAFGYRALQNLTSGNGNIAFGNNAGINIIDNDNNILIGNEGDTITSEFNSNFIKIGNEAQHKTGVFIPNESIFIASTFFGYLEEFFEQLPRTSITLPGPDTNRDFVITNTSGVLIPARFSSRIGIIIETDTGTNDDIIIIVPPFTLITSMRTQWQMAYIAASRRYVWEFAIRTMDNVQESLIWMGRSVGYTPQLSNTGFILAVFNGSVDATWQIHSRLFSSPILVSTDILVEDNTTYVLRIDTDRRDPTETKIYINNQLVTENNVALDFFNYGPIIGIENLGTDNTLKELNVLYVKAYLEVEPPL